MADIDAYCDKTAQGRHVFEILTVVYSFFVNTGRGTMPLEKCAKLAAWFFCIETPCLASDFIGAYLWGGGKALLGNRVKKNAVRSAFDGSLLAHVEFDVSLA